MDIEAVDLVRLLVEFLLVGGGGLALLRFRRDKKKDELTTENVAVAGSKDAVETLRSVLTETRTLLSESRVENKELRQKLEAERDAHDEEVTNLRSDINNLTKQLGEALSTLEVNRMQLARVIEEVERIRDKYNIPEQAKGENSRAELH